MPVLVYSEIKVAFNDIQSAINLAFSIFVFTFQHFERKTFGISKLIEWRAAIDFMLVRELGKYNNI